MGNQADFPLSTMCRVLGVCPSGYYAWRDRKPSRRSQSYEVLTDQIRHIHEGSGGTYGAPRVHFELAKRGNVSAASEWLG